LPHLIAQRPVRGDRRNQHNHTIAGQKLRYESDPANVFVAVMLRKAEIHAQAEAHGVAIQPFDALSPSL
jgi:hypothetical protein